MRKHRLVVLFCSEQLAELKRSIDHELRQRDEDTNVVRNNVGATDHRHAVQPCRALINACHVRTGIASRALTPAQLDSRGSRCGCRGWLCGSSVRDGGKCVCGSSRAIDEHDEATGLLHEATSLAPPSDQRAHDSVDALCRSSRRSTTASGKSTINSTRSATSERRFTPPFLRLCNNSARSLLSFAR